MKTSTYFALTSLSVFLAAACGGTAEGDSDIAGAPSQGDGDNANQLGDGDTGQPIGGDGDVSPPGGDGDSGGDGDVGGAPFPCESEYDDHVAEDPPMLEVVNERSTAVYVGSRQSGCKGDPVHAVYSGDELLRTRAGWCGDTCQQFLEQGPIGCVDGCESGGLFVLEPGESMKIDWRSYEFIEREINRACLDGDYTNPVSCYQRTALSEGTYRVVVAGGSEATCGFGFDPDPCPACKDDDDGNCYLEYSEAAGTELTAEAEVSFPLAGSDPIRLAFTD